MNYLDKLLKNYKDLDDFRTKRPNAEKLLQDELGIKLEDINNVDWRYKKLSENFIREFFNIVDWYEISRFQVLSENFIREFKDYVKWSAIAQKQKLSIEFIREFKSKLNMFYITENQELTEDFIREIMEDLIKSGDIEYSDGREIISNIIKYQTLSNEFIQDYFKFFDNVNFHFILRHQKLSENLIRSIVDYIEPDDEWNIVSRYQDLSENFIRDYDYKVNWDCISKYQNLSEKLIDDYYNKVNWGYISKYQKLSENFIEKFSQFVNWKNIVLYQDLSKNFIINNIDEILSYGRFSLDELIESQESLQDLPKEEIKKELLDAFRKQRPNAEKLLQDELGIKLEDIGKVDWIDVSRNKILSEDFIREFFDVVNWYEISKHQKLSENIIREFLDMADLGMVVLHQDLSKDFIKEIKDKIDWEYIVKENISELSLDFINNCIEYIDLKYIIDRKQLPKDFIIENIGTILTETSDLFSLDFLIKAQKSLQDVPKDEIKKELLDAFRKQRPDVEKILQNELGINLEEIDNIDWDDVSRYKISSEDFIKIFKNKLNWDYISQYQDLSEDLIRNCADKVNWIYIFECQDLSEDFIVELINNNVIDDYCMTVILENQRLSEDFIKKIQSNFNIYNISFNQKINLSEDFIREIADYVDLEAMSEYQIFSEDFIREFKNRVDWEKISMYQDLSEDFIIEFKDYVDWKNIIRNQDLSKEFIIDNISTIMTCSFFNIDSLIENQKSLQDLPKEEIKKELLDAFRKQRPNAEKLLQDELGIKLEDIGKVKWYDISMNKTLSEDFIREFKDCLYLNDILEYQNISAEFALEITNGDYYRVVNNCNYLSKDFIINNIDMILIEGEINLDELIEDQKSLQDLPKEEIKKELLDAFRKQRPNAEKLLQDELGIKIEELYNTNWEYISNKKELSEDFIREFKDFVNWFDISKHQNLSENFILEFKDYVDWKQIIKNQDLSKDFILKNINMISEQDNVTLDLILNNQKSLQGLPKDEIKKELLDELRKQRASKEKPIKNKFISMLNKLKPDFDMNDFVNEAVEIYKNLDGDSRKEFLSELKKQRSNAIDINDKKATIDQIIKIAKQETNNDIKNNCKQNDIGHNNHDTGNR